MNEVLRQEKKYFITVCDIASMGARLEQVMQQDSHNGALGYRIRSLYFDTPDDRDYQEKVDGMELRRKIRLRNYDPDGTFAMLEMKQKQGELQKKRSLRVSRDDARRLIAGEYGVLLKYPEAFAAEVYGLMERLCYRPKTVVEYRRKAFIAKENKIRVTFDSGIIATESHFDIFDEKLAMTPVFDPFHAVLEVKYNGFLLSYIKSLINVTDRAALSVSKYCLARSATLMP